MHIIPPTAVTYTIGRLLILLLRFLVPLLLHSCWNPCLSDALFLLSFEGVCTKGRAAERNRESRGEWGEGWLERGRAMGRSAVEGRREEKSGKAANWVGM